MISLSGELWVVFYEYFGRNWPWHLFRHVQQVRQHIAIPIITHTPPLTLVHAEAWHLSRHVQQVRQHIAIPIITHTPPLTLVHAEAWHLSRHVQQVRQHIAIPIITHTPPLTLVHAEAWHLSHHVQQVRQHIAIPIITHTPPLTLVHAEPWHLFRHVQQVRQHIAIPIITDTPHTNLGSCWGLTSVPSCPTSLMAWSQLVSELGLVPPACSWPQHWAACYRTLPAIPSWNHPPQLTEHSGSHWEVSCRPCRHHQLQSHQITGLHHLKEATTTVNSCRVEFISWNIKIYSFFLLFHNTGMEQVVEILSHGRHGPIYLTQSIPWLLMTWRHKEHGIISHGIDLYFPGTSQFQHQRGCHTEVWTKWLIFCRQHFPVHFNEWKLLDFDSTFVFKDLPVNKSTLLQVMAWNWTDYQAISWTNGDPFTKAYMIYML